METGGDALDASPSVAKLQTAETEGEKSHVCAAVEHAQAQLAPSASASLYTATQAASFSAPSDDRPPKVRKPYIMTKQRERWADEEHQAFLEGIKLYGRAWRKIEGHIGTKTAVQIRSHAQKYFSKLEKQGKLGEGDVVIPPPRPKRKPLRPYPKKAEPIAEAKAETISTAGLTAVTASGLTGPSAEAALSEQVSDPEGGADDKGAGASDALVAAVAAAASAAAAAAAACVVAAASDSVQAKLRENPPSGFPFFGMPPSLLPRGMVMAKGAHLKVQPAAAAGAAAAAAAAPPAGPHAVGGLVSSTGTHRSRSSNGDSAMSNEPGTSQQAKSGRRAAKAPAAAQTSAGFPAAGASALPGRGVDPAVLLPGVPGSSYLSMLSALQAAPLQQAAGQGMLPAAVANAVAWQQLAEMQAGLAGLNATYPVLDGHADFASAGGLPGSQLYMQPKAVKRAAPSDLQGRQQKQAKAFKAPAREGADDGEVEGAHGKEASTPTPGYQEESAENPYLGRSAGTAQTAVKSQGGEGDNGHNSSGGDSNLVNGNGNGNRSGNGSGNGNSTGRTAQPPEAVAGERSTLVQDSERWDVGGQSQLQANRSGNGSRSRSRNASCTGNGSNGSGNKRGEDRGHAQANSGAAYEACLEQGGDDDSRLNNSVAAGEEAPKAPQSQDVVLAERRAALYLNSEMPCRGAFSAMKAVSTSQQPTSAAYQAAASNTGHPQHGPSRASVSHTDSHMKAVMAAMKGGTPRLQSLVGLPAAAAFPHSTMLPSGAALPVADGAAAVVAPAPFLWGPYAGLPGGGMAMAPGMAMVDAASLAGMLQAHTLAGSGSAVPGGAAAMPSGQGGSSNCTLGSSTAAMAGARCHRETESSMQGSLAQLVAALSQQVQDPGSWMAGGALGPASGGGALARPAKSLHGD